MFCVVSEKTQENFKRNKIQLKTCFQIEENQMYKSSNEKKQQNKSTYGMY